MNPNNSRFERFYEKKHIVFHKCKGVQVNSKSKHLQNNNFRITYSQVVIGVLQNKT